jgi:adenylate cyclase
VSRGRRPRWIAVVTVVAAVGAGIAMALLTVFAGAERAALVDRFQPATQAGSDVVIVALDSAFTTRTEQDPLGAFTPLVVQLSEVPTKAVVVEPDVIQLAQSGMAVFNSGYVQAQFEAAIEALGPAVTASVVGDLEPSDDGLPRLARPVPRTGIAAGSIATGFATPIPVEVGQPQRTLPLVATTGPDDGDVVVPSLILAGVLAADGTEDSTAVRIEERSLGIGARRVAVEDGALLRVGYARALLPGGSQVVDGTALTDGNVDPAVLRDKVVFVGVTDPLHAQLFPATVRDGAQMPVVYADANAANTILTESFVAPPSSRDGALLGLGVGVLAAVTVLLLPLWATPIPVGLVMAGMWYLERARVGDGSAFDLMLAWGGVLSAGLVAFVWRIIEVTRARRRTAALFAKYVPDTVAAQLMNDDHSGERSRRVSVATFFCDLRGFTPIAANLEPDDVRRLLDLFYEHVAGAVLDAGGTVMQFSGDEVFAIFGAPLPTAGPPEALAVTRSLLTDGDQLRRALSDNGLPDIHFGIGLHVGPVVAAHVGTARRLQYSVVGDTVNIGSRLCGQAPPDEALLSEDFWTASGCPAATSLGSLSLKGVYREVRGYRLDPVAST